MSKAEYIIKPFSLEVAGATAEVIIKNLKEVNSKDYPPRVIDAMISYYSIENISKIAEKREVYVVIVDGVVKGTASLDGNSICTVFVDPEYHGGGLGKVLMEYIEEVARGKSIKIASLDASLTAHPFYRRLGYVEVKDIESEEFGKAIVMEKIL